jgi:hypothetical protein
MMPRIAHLLPPSLLTPRVAHLASSSLAPHRISAMHWHANACRVALSSATPCPAHYPDADVRTKLLWCCLHENPLPLCASLNACAHVCTLTLSEHGRALGTTLSCLVGPGAHSNKRGPSRSSSPTGCISIRVTVTLSVMSDSLSLPSSHSMFGVLLVDSRGWIWICSGL